jgi:hypothetical protein
MNEKSVILKSERPSRAIIRVSSILLQVIGVFLLDQKPATFMGCKGDERIKPVQSEAFNRNQEGTKSRYLRTRSLQGVDFDNFRI